MSVSLRREDRGVFLLAVAILVVCTIALITVFSIVWNFLQRPIKILSEIFNTQIQLESTKRVDYNFPIDISTDKKSSENLVQETPNNFNLATNENTGVVGNGTDTNSSLPNSNTLQSNEDIRRKSYFNFIRSLDLPLINYNFSVDLIDESVRYASMDRNFLDSIILDLSRKTLQNNPVYNDLTINTFKIKIPKLYLNSFVFASIGDPFDVLSNNKFWISTKSNIFSVGIIDLFCYRGSFKNSRICYYLDNLEKGDFINIEIDIQQQTNYFSFIVDNVFYIDASTFEAIQNSNYESEKAVLRIFAVDENPNKIVVVIARTV